MNTIEMNNTESIIREANFLRWEVGENFHDSLMENIYENAAAIAAKKFFSTRIKRLTITRKKFRRRNSFFEKECPCLG